VTNPLTMTSQTPSDEQSTNYRTSKHRDSRGQQAIEASRPCIG